MDEGPAILWEEGDLRYNAVYGVIAAVQADRCSLCSGLVE